MKVAVCLTKKNKWSQQLVDACCAGVAAHGDEPLLVISSNDLHYVKAADAAIVTCEAKRDCNTGRFSLRNAIADVCESKGIPRLVIETGFIRNIRNRQREETGLDQLYWATGWGGIKRLGDYCVRKPWDDSRWRKLCLPGVPKQGRNNQRGAVLVFGQVEGGIAEEGINLMEEYKRVARAAKEFLPASSLLFRPHPQMTINLQWRFEDYCKQVRALGYDIVHQYATNALLMRARVAVTWTSNASVDALLAGIPVICLHDMNPCWEVSEHEIENVAAPFMPPQEKRQQHANYLAWCQWRVDEIASGEAWALLRTKLNHEREDDAVQALR